MSFSTRVSSPFTHIPAQLAYRVRQVLLYPLADQQRKLIKSLSAENSSETITNKKEIRAVGLRRTGNHAVLNWILSQQAGEVFHLNNVAPGTNPYRYKRDNLLRYHPEHFKMAAVYDRQAKGEFLQRDCLIHSYEDCGLKQLTQRRFERNRSLYLGRSAQRLELLILRDPFNLFASRLKRGYLSTRMRGTSMGDLWLEYAREFLGESQHLGENLVCVNYNRWFTEVEYRRGLAARLGLTFSDAGIDQVTGFGGGSSFAGTQVNGRSLDVLNRWQAFSDDPTFRSLFENEEIWTYSERIFGPIPGTVKNLRPA